LLPDYQTKAASQMRGGDCCALWYNERILMNIYARILNKLEVSDGYFIILFHFLKKKWV